MDLLKIAHAAMQKHADAMARALQRGDIKLDTEEKKIEFSNKLKQLQARDSGNMGMLGDKPFAGGSEGTATLGAMRGKGLGVRKKFIPPVKGVYTGVTDIHDIRSKTINNRVAHMKSIPSLYPEIYGYATDSTNTMYGHIDMEYIPGKDIIREDNVFSRGTDSLNEELQSRNHIAREFKRHGYLPKDDATYINKRLGLVVGDIQGGNIRIDQRTGMPKITDPLVFQTDDPSFVGRTGGKSIPKKVKAPINRAQAAVAHLLGAQANDLNAIAKNIKGLRFR